MYFMTNELWAVICSKQAQKNPSQGRVKTYYFLFYIVNFFLRGFHPLFAIIAKMARFLVRGFLE